MFRLFCPYCWFRIVKSSGGGREWEPVSTCFIKFQNWYQWYVCTYTIFVQYIVCIILCSYNILFVQHVRTVCLFSILFQYVNATSICISIFWLLFLVIISNFRFNFLWLWNWLSIIFTIIIVMTNFFCFFVLIVTILEIVIT